MRRTLQLNSASILLAALTMATGFATFAHEQSSATPEKSGMKATAVRITRQFAAPPDKVWRVWTEPRAVSQWFGSDPNGRVLSASLDVRPGGKFEVTFVDGDGTQHTAHGVYLQVVQPRLLEFTWNWKSEPGIETEITVALSAEESGATTMQFEHGKLIQTSTHNYVDGWRSTFDKMEHVISNLGHSGTRTDF
jgi:uncharacterized protein YndB with AHSA1/START domain